MQNVKKKVCSRGVKAVSSVLACSGALLRVVYPAQAIDPLALVVHLRHHKGIVVEKAPPEKFFNDPESERLRQFIGKYR